MYQITSVRHAWSEPAGFEIDRKQGLDVYTFLHFYDSVHLLVNGKIIITRPHACILYAPDTPQYFTSSMPILHDWFHFSAQQSLPEGVHCDTIYYPANHSYVTNIVSELESEFLTQKAYRDTIIDLKISELLIKLTRSNPDVQTPLNRWMRESLQKLRIEMFMHLEKHWTVNEMASKLYLGTSHFYNAYRTLYGCSPHEDLINARIRAASNALTYSDESITAIAEELGYNNVSHFSRQFHAQTGMSPSAYRKMHSNTGTADTNAP